MQVRMGIQRPTRWKGAKGGQDIEAQGLGERLSLLKT